MKRKKTSRQVGTTESTGLHSDARSNSPSLAKKSAPRSRGSAASRRRLSALEQIRRREQTQEEIELLHLQLEQAQEELESIFSEKQKAERRCAQAIVELESLQRAKTLSEEAAATSNAALSAELTAAIEQLGELQAEHERLRAKLAALKEKPSLRDENELLVLQLQYAYEELERYFLKSQELEKTDPAAKCRRQLNGLAVGDIQIGAVSEAEPYRHVNFRFLNVAYGGRHLASLDLRLVEHHGQVGIVVFSRPPGTVAPLSSWKPNGNEEGRPFMLLHPHHKACKDLLNRMPTSDWLLINDVLVLMEEALSNVGGSRPSVAARWGQVCLRLREQLLDIPPKLRYDVASVKRIGETSANLEVEVNLSQVLFRQRTFEELRLRLKLLGRHGARADLPAVMVFSSPREPSAQPALTVWPLVKEGVWAQEYPLQFGRIISAAQRKAQWQVLSPRDCAFVISLLRILPAILIDGWSDPPPAELDPKWLPVMGQSMIREISTSSATNTKARFAALTRLAG